MKPIFTWLIDIPKSFVVWI